MTPKSKELVLADDLSMPFDAVTPSLAWLAATGAGKSNAVTVFAEQMYGHGCGAAQHRIRTSA